MFMNDIRKIKTDIRNSCKQKRRDLDPEERKKIDSQIYTRLINLWKYRDCETLLAYISGDIEVDTKMIIEDALKRGKRVAVPRCIEGTRNMEFYYITSYDDLEKGSYGILEPKRDKCEKLTDYSSGLCLIPALTFDKEGYRLGFGKGYYDRFLAKFKGETAGLCYECCISQKLPRGKFDRSADVVVTEKRIISKF